MKNNGKIVLTLLAFSVVISQVSFAGPREQAKRIFDRLAGAPATNADLATMEALLGSDSTGKTAANYVIDNSQSFYNVTLKNFATPWTNEAQDVFAPLNDYSATVIGHPRRRGLSSGITWQYYIYRK